MIKTLTIRVKMHKDAIRKAILNMAFNFGIGYHIELPKRHVLYLYDLSGERVSPARKFFISAHVMKPIGWLLFHFIIMKKCLLKILPEEKP